MDRCRRGVKADGHTFGVCRLRPTKAAAIVPPLTNSTSRPTAALATFGSSRGNLPTMRLCLVISSLSAGGAERVMSTLANAWAGRGHDVHLLTTHDGGAPPHFELDSGVRLVSVDPRATGPLKQVAVVRALRRGLQARRPDAVISFLNYTNILTLLACRGLRLPVIVSERLDPRVIGIGPLWSTLRRLTYPGAARLVAQTPTAARLYEPLCRHHVTVIPNPVSVPADVPAAGIEWPSPERPTIIAVGRLQPQKGYEVALRAMARLARTHPDWRLVILGEGPQRSRLEALRQELGLADSVVFAGRVPEPWPWLKRAGLYLMSSHSEGFPNALAEAMAAGLPCVSTDCPSGPADLITPGVDGLLVPPGDDAAMAAALATLIDQPQLRARLAAAAGAVGTRFALETVLAQWDATLADVLGDGSGPAGPAR